MKKISLLLICCITVLLVGCNSSEETPAETTLPDSAIAFETINTSELFSDRDYETEYTLSDCISIIRLVQASSGFTSGMGTGRDVCG